MTDSPEQAARDALRKREQQQKIQRQLDEALEDSFPASDPVSIVTSHEEEDWGVEKTPTDPPPKTGNTQEG